MIDPAFVETAQRYLNPYVMSSGTENVAVLLYALARMTRPKIIVEYGSGYTTLLLLRALADNMRDDAQERSSLLQKSERWLAAAPAPPIVEKQDGRPVMKGHDAESFNDWFGQGHKACAAKPSHYLQPYEPHLYSFETLGQSHTYVQALEEAISELGVGHLFSYLHGHFSHAALPKEARAIDWAWNDDHDYVEFFNEFWPHLNPAGGLLIFHNVPAFKPWFDAVEWMKEQRAATNDVEVLVLEEPHKLNQNGCAILRKVSAYTPHYVLADPIRNWHAAAELVRRSR